MLFLIFLNNKKFQSEEQQQQENTNIAAEMPTADRSRAKLSTETVRSAASAPGTLQTVNVNISSGPAGTEPVGGLSQFFEILLGSFWRILWNFNFFMLKLISHRSAFIFLNLNIKEKILAFSNKHPNIITVFIAFHYSFFY